MSSARLWNKAKRQQVIFDALYPLKNRGAGSPGEEAQTTKSLRWVIIATMRLGACQHTPLDEAGQQLATQSLLMEIYHKPPHNESLTRCLEEEFGA